MASARLVYCSLVNDVIPRLFAAISQISLPGIVASPTGALPDAQRDALLATLIADCSRRFDSATGVEAGHYAPSYDVRMYSGNGSMLLPVEHFAALAKVEWNNQPSTNASPNWIDITSELATPNKMNVRPIKYWPKDSIFRADTWVVDPFESGNVRLTGIFGNVEADFSAATPTAPWVPTNLPSQSLNSTAITALQPVDSTGTKSGWWVTPEPVVAAVADWAVFRFHKSRAGYSDTAGEASGGSPQQYALEVPKTVQEVIDTYSRTASLHVAMITGDGSDIAYEKVHGSNVSGAPSRWSAWQTQ